MEKETKIKPPAYLSAKKLEKVLSIVSARNLSSLTPAYFSTYSFSNSDANLAIASLRFLGLIDANSKSTPLMVKMAYKGEVKTKAFVGMIKMAYKKLLEVVPEPYSMNKDDLHNDFRNIYKISGRVAASAVPAFIYLCKRAGLRKVQTQSNPKKTSNSTPVKKIASSKKTGASSETDSEHTVIPFGKSGIKLVLPTDVLTNISLFEDYKILIKSVATFSDKYSIEPKDKNENHETNSTEE